MSNKKNKNAKNNAKPAEKKEAVAEKNEGNEKKYVNPILAWALIGCTLCAAICIGLGVLLSL